MVEWESNPACEHSGETENLRQTLKGYAFSTFQVALAEKEVYSLLTHSGNGFLKPNK